MCIRDSRGREQKGYSGGEIERTWQPDEAPKLAPHQRLDDAAADEIAQLVRAFYDSGQSIRDIASTTNYSIQRVRSLLQHAGADLRPRGGTHS